MPISININKMEWVEHGVNIPIFIQENDMKKLLTTLALTTLVTGNLAAQTHEHNHDHDDLVDGLNVVLTSGEPQTQMMAMVLSMMTVEQHKKVNMVLCDKAGSLAVKGTSSPMVKAMEASPKQILQKLISDGVDVKLCPLYLPSIGKDDRVLIKGVMVAEPDKVAKNLLHKNFNTLSY